MERSKKFKFGMLTCGERSESTMKANLKNRYEVKRYATDKGSIEKDLNHSMLVINRAIRDIKETLGEIKTISGYCHRARTPSHMSASEASCPSLSNKLSLQPFSEEAVKHSEHFKLLSGLESRLCSKNKENIVKQLNRGTVTSNSPDSGYQSSRSRGERCMSDGMSVVSRSSWMGRSAPVSRMNGSKTTKTTQCMSSKMTPKAHGQSHPMELLSENPSPLTKQKQFGETLSKHNPVQNNIRKSVSRTRKLRSKSASTNMNCVRNKKEFQPGTPKSLGNVDFINTGQTDNSRWMREVLVGVPVYSYVTRDSSKVIMSKSAIQRSLKRITLEYNKPNSLIHLEKERQKLLHGQVTAFVDLLFMDGKHIDK